MRTLRVRSTGFLAALLLTAGNAQAALLITAVETAGDVVFSTEAGGSLDLGGLTFLGTGSMSTTAFIWPSYPVLRIGVGGSLPDVYSGVLAPANFGSGGTANSAIVAGDQISLEGGALRLPNGYVSGDPFERYCHVQRCNVCQSRDPDRQPCLVVGQ